MDGPSVNKLFKEKFESDLEKRGHFIIDVRSCPLHTVDLDQFAVDLHSFFRFSAKRIEEYFDVERFTEIYGQRILRQVSTRWISLQDVLVRIMEQFDNLREYFLKFLPTQKGFNGKSGIAASERYIRIKNALTNKMLPTIAYSVIFIAQDYKAFTVALQSKQPMITCLFTKMQKLLKELLSKFVEDDAILKSTKQLKPISKLKALDLNDAKIQKAKCDLGTRAYSEMTYLEGLVRKQVVVIMKRFLSRSCSYLLKNLPLNIQVIRDAKYLHPNEHFSNRAVDAVDRMAQEVFDGLGGTMANRILKKGSRFDFCDAVRKEMQEFQTESITDDFVDKDECSLKSSLSRPSYWATCYDQFGIQFHHSSAGVDVEFYWRKVLNFKNEDGKPKYFHLANLAMMILLLPHGNADPERGFSINKRLLEKHGFNTGEETLESIRIVKDFLIQSGGQNSIEVTPSMIERCKKSRAMYEKHLEEKRQKENAKRKDQEKQQEDVAKQLKAVEDNISRINAQIEAAEKLVEDGNKLLKVCVKNMNQAIFIDGQQKVELGQKRKQELKKDLDTELAKKKKFT